MRHFRFFFRDKAALALTSIFEHAHFEKNETFHTHFVCDPKSREFIEQYVQENVHDPGFVLKVGVVMYLIHGIMTEALINGVY